MKVCIALRQPIRNKLREENLRSEPRWERLALEACMQNTEITDIYTLGNVLPNAYNYTNKYRGILSYQEDASDCILLVQDWNTSICKLFNYKAIIAHIFHGPWEEQKEDIATVSNSMNKKLYFAFGHPSLFNTIAIPEDKPQTLSSIHMRNFIDIDQIVFLPLPWIPESRFKDRFFQNSLLYASRLIFVSDLTTKDTLYWAFQKMLSNKDLTLRIITGWFPHEVKDYINNEPVYIKKDINDYFWTLEKFLPYKEALSSRVKIYNNLDWNQILNAYQDTKLLLTHSINYGGAPMEAAMHGVPFIGTSEIDGALVDCPDYLVAKGSDELVNILDSLYSDHEFYSKIAQSYHDYVMDLYSFDAFNKRLNNILKDKAIL